ncbi:type II toxin-antitoxin system RelE/ParE family toxin [Candidatus Gracilibacteria bacterium]|nr:type II toxin-antitoxin system RelE/ParE family toxin [Candidatus Gracilibacteria bacterium]
MTKEWIKFIKKQPNHIAKFIYETVEKIVLGDTSHLNIVSISGKDNMYRCRIGNIRIVFTDMNGEIEIKKIGYRGGVYKRIQ